MGDDDTDEGRDEHDDEVDDEDEDEEDDEEDDEDEEEDDKDDDEDNDDRHDEDDSADDNSVEEGEVVVVEVVVVGDADDDVSWGPVEQLTGGRCLLVGWGAAEKAKLQVVLLVWVGGAGLFIMRQLERELSFCRLLADRLAPNLLATDEELLLIGSDLILGSDLSFWPGRGMRRRRLDGATGGSRSSQSEREQSPHHFGWPL